MFRKVKSAVEGDPNKSWSENETEARGEPGGVRGGITFAWIERKIPVLRSVLQTNQSSLYSLHRSRDREGGGPNGQIVGIKRTADMEGREA